MLTVSFKLCGPYNNTHSAFVISKGKLFSNLFALYPFTSTVSSVEFRRTVLN